MATFLAKNICLVEEAYKVQRYLAVMFSEIGLVTVNSRNCGHPRDSGIISLIARVCNSRVGKKSAVSIQ